jgi:hypothetical protein
MYMARHASNLSGSIGSLESPGKFEIDISYNIIFVMVPNPLQTAVV